MKIAIAWYGAEGQSSYRYYRDQGHDVTIVTPRVSDQFPIPDDAKLITGNDAFDHLDGFDVVVRSAGVNPNTLRTDGRLWSSTNEFLEQCQAQIIGVTGTKGKGTTCSLIVSILRAAGKRVHLVGNIGTPPLDILSSIHADDIVVFEMSSFQLWDAARSPHIAVVLPIEPDHLDVHTGMDDYIAAKMNITIHQNAPDVLIWNPQNPIADSFPDNSTAIRMPYTTKLAAYTEDGYFWFRDERLCSVDELQLPGQHNQENACAAITAAWHFISESFYEAVKAGLNNCTGLPHRLQYVAEKNDIKYYDDSISTTPGSAVAAIRSFAAPIVLVLGGREKGADYQELLQLCHDENVQVLLIGENRDKLAQLCVQYHVNYVVESGDMRAIVQRASKQAKKGGVVILSPAAASFDMFASYADRGDQFVAAVNELV